MKTKRCPRCEKTKPYSDYFKYSRTNNGITVYCKACSGDIARTPKMRMSQARARAKNREVPWLMTLEEFEPFLSKPCTYCNGPLPETGSGLDRVDETIGYRKDNVVPSCALCNHLKHSNLTFNEMKVMGKAVKEIRKMRGLGPKDQILMHHQVHRERRNYRTRRKGGILMNGHVVPLPPRRSGVNL